MSALTLDLSTLDTYGRSPSVRPFPTTTTTGDSMIYMMGHAAGFVHQHGEGLVLAVLALAWGIWALAPRRR